MKHLFILATLILSLQLQASNVDIGGAAAAGPETDPLALHIDGSTTPTADIGFGDFDILDIAELRQTADAVADANPAKGFSIIGTAKSAGTGDGGPVTIVGGSSVGGAEGDILLNSDALIQEGETLTLVGASSNNITFINDANGNTGEQVLIQAEDAGTYTAMALMAPGASGNPTAGAVTLDIYPTFDGLFVDYSAMFFGYNSGSFADHYFMFLDSSGTGIPYGLTIEGAAGQASLRLDPPRLGNGGDLILGPGTGTIDGAVIPKTTSTFDLGGPNNRWKDFTMDGNISGAVSVKPQDNTTADAAAADPIVVRAGNKTAGTGNGGAGTFSSGTSAGGTGGAWVADSNGGTFSMRSGGGAVTLTTESGNTPITITSTGTGDIGINASTGDVNISGANIVFTGAFVLNNTLTSPDVTDLNIETPNNGAGDGPDIKIEPGTGATADASGVIRNVGKTSYSAQSVTLTADNQQIRPEDNVLVLNSDSVTATDRSLDLLFPSTIPAGEAFILTIIADVGTNRFELQGSGTRFLAGTWSPDDNDTLMLVYRSSEWREISRSAN